MGKVRLAREQEQQELVLRGLGGLAAQTWPQGLAGPLHTSGGARCSQDCGSRGAGMILSSRISLCWHPSDDLGEVCTSLEPGQEKIPLQFPKMQPCSMGTGLSHQPGSSGAPCALTPCCSSHESANSPLNQSSLRPSITQPWNRHTPGLTRTINRAKLVLWGGKQLKTYFSGSLTVES